MPLSLKQASQLTLLSPFQREFLQRSVDTNKRALRRQSADFDGATNERIWDDGDEMAPDPNDVRSSLARDESMLQKYSPLNQPRKPYDLHKYLQMVRDLDKVISEGMLSDDQMREPTAHNIDAFLRWQERCINGRHPDPKYRGLNLVQARSTLIRMLDPNSDDPNLTSPERLRPEKPVRINLQSYYAGYDEIQFQDDEIVDAAMDSLDDDRFQRFCQYKAANWPTKLIQRELGFDAALYEAALKRLKEIRDLLAQQASNEAEPDEPEPQEGEEEQPDDAEADEAPVPEDDEPQEQDPEPVALASNGHATTPRVMTAEQQHLTVLQQQKARIEHLARQGYTLTEITKELALTTAEVYRHMPSGVQAERKADKGPPIGKHEQAKRWQKEGLTHKAIAQKMGCHLSTVSWYLSEPRPARHAGRKGPRVKEPAGATN